MFLKLSSNIVGKLSPNIAIYRLVGTELNYVKKKRLYLKRFLISSVNFYITAAFEALCELLYNFLDDCF